MPEDVYWKSYSERFKTFSPLISSELHPQTKNAICIPVCCEPDLIKTLESLLICLPSENYTEVLLLFNKNDLLTQAELEIHEQSWVDCKAWIQDNRKEGLSFIPVYVTQMPDLKGGVGWARKLVMDEAARRLDKDGIIICLDGDCTVSDNYLVEIEDQFNRHSSFDAASIYFEHQYAHLGEEERNAIIRYELHLRYLVHAQRWCGHPHAYQTVGSSMAVRRNAYLSQGGMNTRRAGEDFYFLQKFITTEKTFEIKRTTVYPSPRSSNRVPFGTGKAMIQMLSDGKEWRTTNFESFQKIKPLFHSLEGLREGVLKNADHNHLRIITGIRDEVYEFLISISFFEQVQEIVNHTNTLISFQKRFFRFFNAFQMIRYMHFMREHFFPDTEMTVAVNRLFKIMNPQFVNEMKEENSLNLFRSMDCEVKK